MHRPSAAEADFAEELAVLRPDLVARYTAELPGARAAVLSRLWRGLAHEPLPWVTGREAGREGSPCASGTAAGCTARTRTRSPPPPTRPSCGSTRSPTTIRRA